METNIFKLSFSQPVHFGNGRLSDSAFAIDSATLFSALYLEALKLGEAELLLKAAQEGNLSLSDAFPYVGEILYLPKPTISFNEIQEKNTVHSEKASLERKASKKLQYIAINQWNDYLSGSLDSIDALEAFNIGSAYLSTKVNLTRKNKDDADPYHIGGFVFAPNAGLYFISDGSYDLEPLLNQLQYSGLGGKRTSGYGRFSYQANTVTLPLSVQSQSPKRWMLLSSAVPTEQELCDELLSGAHFRLKRKSGYVQSENHAKTPQKKKDFYVFAAGSVFEQKFEGLVVDVNATPNAHPVYRYARAMWMEV